ncbi:MAG: hypothetical protein F6K28_22695, partial [Microcoleus sp. SIO2G3]|nr:hypothetical protein [Microcoleus sp. SIO2G3]
MPSSKQTSFTASSGVLNLAARWFWRRSWKTIERLALVTKRRWMLVLLGALTLLLTLSFPSLAQTSSNAAEAPVVLDGRVLFQVRNSGNFSAAERAGIINNNLEQEVRSRETLKIEVVQENQRSIIRSLSTSSN